MKHFCEKWFYPFIALSLGACASSPVPEAEIVVDYSQKGAEVNPKMYGIFFEEINHSGDGSLYGELLRNRNFEEGVIPSGTVYKDGFAVAKHAPTYSDHRFRDWKIRWDKDSLEMIGWAVDGPATYAIVSDNPLHPNTPNAMKLTMEGAGATLTNEGYWGVPVVKDDKYDLRFYLNPVAYSGNVTAEIVDAQGKVLSSEKFAIKARGKNILRCLLPMPLTVTQVSACHLTIPVLSMSITCHCSRRTLSWDAKTVCVKMSLRFLPTSSPDLCAGRVDVSPKVPLSTIV